MAEIKVEKKKNYWGWIIGALLAVGVIIYFLMADTDGAPEYESTDQVETEGTGNGEAGVRNGASEMDAEDAAKAEIMQNPDAQITEFTEFIGDNSKMGIDHEYTSEALVKLVNATIERAVVSDVDIDTELRSAIQKAEAITNDPMDTDHSDKNKKAYHSVTEVIGKIQGEKFPQLSDEMEEVRDAVQSIDPAVLTLEQKEKVNSYFKKAADILQQMNTNS